MKKSRKLAWVVLGVVVVGNILGCVSRGPYFRGRPFSIKDVRRLELGISREDVSRKLGAPTLVVDEQGVEVWTYECVGFIVVYAEFSLATLGIAEKRPPDRIRRRVEFRFAEGLGLLSVKFVEARIQIDRAGEYREPPR